MVSLTAIIVLLLGIKSCVKSESSSFGYELVSSHLDSLQLSLKQLSVDVKQQAEQFKIHQKLVKSVQQQLNHIFERQEQNMIQLMERMQKSVSDINDQSRQILDFIEQPKHAVLTPNDIPTEVTKMAVCSLKNNRTSETCLMDIGKERAVSVYTEQNCESDWLVIMHRFDGSEDFDRDWYDYRNGFGTARKEHWLGLERLYELTRNTSNKLRVELEDFYGNHRYAEYDSFSIGPEADDYPLEKLGAYSGTAGDPFKYHIGTKFSTRDKGSWKRCALEFTGGWWYGVNGQWCYEVHPTGTWSRKDLWRSIVWKSFGSPEHLAMKAVKMMIRQANK